MQVLKNWMCFVLVAAIGAVALGQEKNVKSEGRSATRSDDPLQVSELRDGEKGATLSEQERIALSKQQNVKGYSQPADPFVVAGGPANDLCANAVEIFDGATAFSNAGATTDGSSDPLCQFALSDQINQDIWYNYTATCTGTLDISLCGSGFDTRVAIYQGSGCTGAIIACNDDFCGLQSRIPSAAVTQGNAYKIRVGGYQTATGSGTINITCNQAQGGDGQTCEAAVPIFDGATPFSTIGATTDGPPNAACNFFGNNQIGQDIWFNYTASCTGTLQVSLCGSGYDTKVALYNGTQCLGDILACNDDFCGLQSRITAQVTQGNGYKLRVGGFAAATGTGTINITCGGGGGNDNCANSIEVFNGATPFSTVGATTDGPPNAACAFFGDMQVNQDIWFHYTATCNGSLVASLCGSGYDTKIAIYSGLSCVGPILGCNDDSCGLQSVVIVPVTQGGVYKIRVGGYAAATGTGTLNLSCSQPAGNDSCASATNVTDGTYTFSTFGATTDGPPSPTCTFFGDNQVNQDIWFNYTATCSQTLSVSLCGSMYDTKLAVYESDACVGNILACNDDSCGLQSRVMTSVTAGNVYKIRVGGYTTATGSGTMTISCGAGPCDAGVGTCCQAHSGVGCEDSECCSEVCACDPFCCNTMWDMFCAGTGFVAGCGAALLCENQPCYVPPPSNNACADAIPIGLGSTGFSNVGTTNDGPALPAECNEGFGLGFGSDVWFRYQSDCSGTLSVSTCNQAGYDTRMAMYHSCSCPVTNASLVACNDDGPGCAGFTSLMEAVVTQGECYLIRIGGFGGAQGAGTVTLDCDEFHEACLTGTGSCLESHETPGCNDPLCCDRVCDDDSFCCDVEWDGACAGVANIICVAPPNDECQDAPIESLPHTYTGSNFNADPDCALFSPPPNQVWIAFQIPTDSSVTLNYCGTSPAFGNAWLNLALGCPCTGFTAAGAFNTTACGDGNVTITWQCLTAGTYYYPILTEPGSTGQYTINVSAGECIDPCVGATGDCFVEHPTPGCNNQACCQLICGLDPFCCNTSWDAICVDEANDFCTGAEPPANDLCANGIDVSEGTYAFTNVGAATDGPGLPASCDEGFGLSMMSDVWYDYTPTLSGQATIDVCAAGYDARMSVYQGCNCPASNANLVACNDDGCGDIGGPPTVTFPASAGTCYKVRIGGYAAAQGSGSFTISLSGIDCPSGPVAFTSPPSGVIDARQDNTPAGGPVQGISVINATAPAGVPAACWSFCETSNGGLPPNSIASVAEGPAGTYAITLARPITPGAVSTVRYLGNGTTGSFISHPANANGDSASNPIDILRLIDYLNGVAMPPWGIYGTDIDRSGVANPADILRLIDLLNGAGALSIWNNTTLPMNPGTCP